MAKVQVLNVSVLDNPSPFGNPFQFEITFECMEDLPEGDRFHKFTVYTYFCTHFVNAEGFECLLQCHYVLNIKNCMYICGDLSEKIEKKSYCQLLMFTRSIFWRRRGVR